MSELQYPFDSSHPNRRGHELLSLFYDMETDDQRKERVSVLGNDDQAAVLLASAEQKEWFLKNHSRHPQYAVCKSVMWRIYERRPSLTSEQIAQLLLSASFGCGHDGVHGPFDLMQEHVRKHGLSPIMQRALQDYMLELKGMTSIASQNTRMRGAFILLLAPEGELDYKKCFSAKFTEEVRCMPEKERLAWSNFMVEATLVQRTDLPTTVKKKLQKFVDSLGAAAIIETIETCWPDKSSERPIPVDTGGSHLYKQFVWILESLADKHQGFIDKCDELIVRMSELDWKPKEKAQKIMVPAACYLRSRPPAVSAKGLYAIAEWCKTVPKTNYTGSKMEQLIRDFEREHQIALKG